MVDYTLEIAVDVTAQEMLEFIHGVLDIDWTDETHLAGKGLWIACINSLEESSKLILEGFGFSPSVSLTFEVDKFEEHELGTLTMYEIIHKVLHKFSGDGVFLVNGEIIILQRIDQKLVFNSGYDDWSKRPEIITLFSDFGYEVKDLPSPLL